jgi:DNA-binding MarR family transcriptional regulator
VFADVLRLLRRDFYARTEGLGLTPALARLLLYVARAPDSRQIDLATRLEVTPVTLGRMVDRLVERGCLRRVADATDRRAYRVRITAAAEPLVARLERIATATRERALAGFSAADRRQLLRYLRQLHTNLDGTD